MYYDFYDFADFLDQWVPVIGKISLYVLIVIAVLAIVGMVTGMREKWWWEQPYPGWKDGSRFPRRVYRWVVGVMFLYALICGSTWQQYFLYTLVLLGVVIGFVVDCLYYRAVGRGSMAYGILRGAWRTTAQPMDSDTAQRLIASWPSPDVMPSWHGAPGLGYAHRGFVLNDGDAINVTIKEFGMSSEVYRLAKSRSGNAGDKMINILADDMREISRVNTAECRNFARFLASLPQIADGTVHVFWRCGGHDCVLAWNDQVACIDVVGEWGFSSVDSDSQVGRALEAGRGWVLSEGGIGMSFVPGPTAGKVVGGLRNYGPASTSQLRAMAKQWGDDGVGPMLSDSGSSDTGSLAALADTIRTRYVVEGNSAYRQSSVRFKRYVALMPNERGGAGILTFCPTGKDHIMLWGTGELMQYLFSGAPITPPSSETVRLLDALVFDLIDLYELQISPISETAGIFGGLASNMVLDELQARTAVANARRERRKAVAKVRKRNNARYAREASVAPSANRSRIASISRFDDKVGQAELHRAMQEGDRSLRPSQNELRRTVRERKAYMRKEREFSDRAGAMRQEVERLVDVHDGAPFGAEGYDRHRTFLNEDESQRIPWSQVSNEAFNDL